MICAGKKTERETHPHFFFFFGKKSRMFAANVYDIPDSVASSLFSIVIDVATLCQTKTVCWSVE